MSFKNLTIKRSYRSCGDNNIVDSFLVPALKYTKLYKRSVGFFSSGVLVSILDGIGELVKNGGKIRLIASPKLSKEDIEAISKGYELRDKVIEAVDREFNIELDTLDYNKLDLLVELISKNILDIKIAISESLGIYHDKLGILEDFEGNSIVFYGSANSSVAGYKDNYEKIRIEKSWDVHEYEGVMEETEEFDDLWFDRNNFVKVYDYKECAKQNILQVVERKRKNDQKDAPIQLRDYQETAIRKWVENGYKGFYVMATGTGKTWTAIFSAKELLKKHEAMIVIIAPYKHLVNQWAEDIEKVFSDAKIILVSSENLKWERQLNTAIIENNIINSKQIIVISTIASFERNKFKTILEKSKQDKLLIVDEAHRFTNRPEFLKAQFKYMLGLSATPFSGKEKNSGVELIDYFGGLVFNLHIEEALEKGFLVNYNYYPIYVTATSDEEEKFSYYSSKMISCFKNNKCINPEKLAKYYRARLRVMAMSYEKQRRLPDIIKKINFDDHFVVYCGDGILFDEEGNEKKHIDSINDILDELGYKSSQFTAKENIKERMKLVDIFNDGEISSLVAIRCLDEGINIPSIKSALILASNDNYREFVQRRGRILRVYDGKEYANIYDIIVLPSSTLSSWAKIELRRFYEYGKLALNWKELKTNYYKLLRTYGLELEDIDTFEYEEVERELDE